MHWLPYISLTENLKKRCSRDNSNNSKKNLALYPTDELSQELYQQHGHGVDRLTTRTSPQAL